MEDKLETSDGEGLLDYIKNIVPYVSNMDATLLVFAWDVEALEQFLSYELGRLRIRTESDHGRICQD